MKRTFSFIFGALAGGFVGALLALLFAPKSGTELRQDIVEFADQVQTEVRQAAVTKRQELEAQLASFRVPKTGS